MTIQNEVYTDHEGFGQYTPGETQTAVDTCVYNFVFHYNAYTGLWTAIPRDLYNEYWSDYNVPGVLRSSSIDTLLYLLRAAGGDVAEVNKIVGV